MSTQLITRVSHNSTSERSSASESRSNLTANDDTQLRKIMKSYQADQQVKYLYLQAEIDVLLQQLQTLNKQKLRTTVAGADKN